MWTMVEDDTATPEKLAELVETDAESLNETVSWALMLHQRLPEAPAVSGRAITSISHLSGKLKAIQTTNNAAPI